MDNFFKTHTPIAKITANKSGYNLAVRKDVWCTVQSLYSVNFKTKNIKTN